MSTFKEPVLTDPFSYPFESELYCYCTDVSQFMGYKKLLLEKFDLIESPLELEVQGDVAHNSLILPRTDIDINSFIDKKSWSGWGKGRIRLSPFSADGYAGRFEIKYFCDPKPWSQIANDPLRPMAQYLIQELQPVKFLDCMGEEINNPY
jgi:hypothetical protein